MGPKNSGLGSRERLATRLVGTTLPGVVNQRDAPPWRLAPVRLELAHEGDDHVDIDAFRCIGAGEKFERLVIAHTIPPYMTTRPSDQSKSRIPCFI